MSVELIIDVLKTILFFPSLISIDRFLLDTIILFSIYTSLAYLITLFVLQSTAYKSKREFVDSDFRVKLGWSVGLLFSIFILLFSIINCSIFTYYCYSNLTRILHFTLYFFCYICSKLFCHGIIDIFRLHQYTYFPACLDCICF